MSAVIRLKHAGTNKKPVHKIVVMDKHSARDSKSIEILGYYDPKTDPAKIEVRKERAAYWLGVGATPSPAVKTLLKKKGIKA